MPPKRSAPSRRSYPPKRTRRTAPRRKDSPAKRSAHPQRTSPPKNIAHPARSGEPDLPQAQPASTMPPPPKKRGLLSRAANFLNTVSYNFFTWILLVIYLLPVAFMMVTAFKSTDQLSDNNAPWYPSRKAAYGFQGRAYPLFRVPDGQGGRELALVETNLTGGEFLDPGNPAAGRIAWEGDTQSLKAVYEPHLEWSNFTILFNNLAFPEMMRNTLFLVVVGGIGVLVSSILIAYGFSRFPLPGGDLLFYVLIASILIPEKVTFIPTFFFYIKVMHWQGTFLPLVLHLFFGSPVFIFLLRQNFKGIPFDLEESAMLDGAGPLRRLWSIVLPLSWPAVVTISLLQLFYTWNETRLASLYLGINSHLTPLSFGVQVYQSYVPIQNVIEAGSMVVLAFPVLVLILSQRLFMRSMVITGMEKR
jgi:multiple sugar transport system permease protein